MGPPRERLDQIVRALSDRRDRRRREHAEARAARQARHAALESRQRELQILVRDRYSTLIDLAAMLAATTDPEATTGLIGEGAALARARLEILHGARLDLPVLIEGESGTGKELAARAIHRLGLRGAQPFLSLDCEACEGNRLEAELFGYAAGAFSGAGAAHPGLLARAHGGTLLLEGALERPPAFQAKLLRAVEGKSVRPLGGEPREVDCRIIATTRLDVDAALAAGRIDRGLYFRLAVARVRLPPLRAHPEDIPLIVAEQLRVEKVALRFAPEVLERLRTHGWPGNVRELRNLVTRWILLAEDQIDLEHLPPELAQPSARAHPAWRVRPLAEVEREHIRRALAQAQGDKAQAARILGITRTTLYAKLQDLGADA